MANAASSDRVLHALREAKLQLESAKARAQEPLAIVGMACRFPGAHDVEAFWDVLSAGKDMTTAMPEDRWNVDAYYDPLPATPGKMYVRHGAFIDHVDQFDPLFFGISPREAASMDPQHRLLLEVSWEALERAGLAPTQLKGSQSGVFVGITGNDYARVEGDAEHIHGYAATGNYSFFASGRLSHVLGLQGPSLAIDTGCSASLVAVHAAMQSLRLGECDLALAGGVSLMLSPEAGIAFCQMQALAPDGRCKAFDATANGYGQGEGCGIVVLKRLSDAVADHDTILALLRGSAVNHDGPSSGLTVPSKLAQERVIRSALKNGNVDAHQVMYVDGHGAGTSLGDPIEVRALGDVFDVEQRQHPLMVGSVKTNIGHLEAAAGIASLIKVVLALQHHEMPPHLHFHSPSPHIDWDHLPIRVPTQPTPWPVGRRYGGVSSFGMGGTNGHLVIEEAPGEDEAPHAVMDRDWHILTLSAQSEPALNDLVDRFIDFLKDHPQAVLSDVCYTANVGRSDFAHRLSITATSIEQLRHKLSSFQNGAHRVGAGVSQGFAPDYQASPRIAMRFAGEGPLHVNMGRDLYETQPTFRQALDRCDALLRPMLTKSLLDVLYAGLPGRTTEGLADDAQLALFGFEYALATLWQSWGITPHLVIGDGVGEYVAACVAGVFSLEDALRLVTAHSRLARHHPQDGRQSEFEPMAQSVTYSRPRLELVSAPSAKRVTDDVMTADYWVRHAQQPLSHASGIVPLTDHGCHLVVDIGPTSAARPHVLEDAVTWLPSMQEGLSDWQQMLSSLGELYVRGADIDWAGFDQDYARRKEVLPTYPFQRQRYWADVVRKRRDHTRVRPLIDKMVKSPLLKETLFETEFSTHALPFLTDHRVYDQVVSAAACHLALVLSGWEAAYGAPEVLIETVFFPEALVVPDGESRTVQLVFEPEANAQHTGFGSTFQLISFTGEDTDTSSGDAPATHATGRLTAPMGTALAAVSLDEIQRRCVEAVDVETVYQTAERQQISLGSQFRWLEAIWRSERADEALGKLRPPPAVGSLAGYVLHPGLLDNCFQLTGVASAGQGTDDTLLPLQHRNLAPASADRRPGMVVPRPPSR